MPETNAFIAVQDAELPLFAGIDVGGTNIKIGLVDHRGRSLAYHKIPTEREMGAEHAAERIGDGVRHVVSHAGVTTGDVARIGLATPGPIDIPSGMLLSPGNLPEWWDFPIRDRVSHHCGLPAAFANDANAAAYGEYWIGAGQDVHSMVLLTLGTGIGGGIVVEDTLVEGAHSCGSECGYILIHPDDERRIDSLGNTGSLESYCGAYAVVARTNEALDMGRESTLAKLRTASEPITPLAISNAADDGDAFSLEIIMETAYYLAIGCVTLIHAIDPECVVLGGAMTFGGQKSPLGRQFLDRIRQEVRSRLLAPLRDPLRIDFASLGGDAGYIGAAGLARREHRGPTSPK